MDAPTASFAIASLVVLAVPGFIHAAIRRWAAGEQPGDRDAKALFARGLVFTVTLSAVYFLILGPWMTAGYTITADKVFVSQPRLVALLVVVLYIVIPAIISIYIVRRDLVWEAPKSTHLRTVAAWMKLPSQRYHYTSVPTSWDAAWRAHENGSWVKVRRSDGLWVGGWFTGGSHATTYPEPESIYIDQRWEMNDDGTFGDAVDDSGLWVKIDPKDLVIWVRGTTTETEGEDNDGQ